MDGCHFGKIVGLWSLLAPCNLDQRDLPAFTSPCQSRGRSQCVRALCVGTVFGWRNHLHPTLVINSGSELEDSPRESVSDVEHPCRGCRESSCLWTCLTELRQTGACYTAHTYIITTLLECPVRAAWTTGTPSDCLVHKTFTVKTCSSDFKSHQ